MARGLVLGLALLASVSCTQTPGRTPSSNGVNVKGGQTQALYDYAIIEDQRTNRCYLVVISGDHPTITPIDCQETISE